MKKISHSHPKSHIILKMENFSPFSSFFYYTPGICLDVFKNIFNLNVESERKEKFKEKMMEGKERKRRGGSGGVGGMWK